MLLLPVGPTRRQWIPPDSPADGTSATNVASDGVERAIENAPFQVYFTIGLSRAQTEAEEARPGGLTPNRPPRREASSKTPRLLCAGAGAIGRGSFLAFPLRVGSARVCVSSPPSADRPLEYGCLIFLILFLIARSSAKLSSLTGLSLASTITESCYLRATNIENGSVRSFVSLTPLVARGDRGADRRRVTPQEGVEPGHSRAALV